MKVLTVLEAPFRFIGKVFTGVEVWLPKIIGIAAFTETESKILTPALVLVVKDVEDLAKYVTADGIKTFEAIEAIITEISQLGGAGALDPTHYAKIISSVNTFIANVHGDPDWAALFPAVRKAIADFDALGAEAKDALARVGVIIHPDDALQVN